MIPELGQWALILALLLALLQAGFGLAGAQRVHPAWMALARRAALLQAALVTLAFVALLQACARGDYSVAYVAAHTNSLLPLPYRLAATWGGHEGSLLLWAQILAGWTCAVALRSATLPPAFAARVLGVLGGVAAGFLGFLLFTSNPFARELPPALDGRDLNPLLQDPGMVAHPPLLYMGYVGYAVAFAFAVAALLEGRLDAAWARWVRPWTLAAWACLTGGIALGSFWAYYELGWGGWWFWDAVENASLMPWLVGTALIHSLAVAEQRGSFKGWTVLLALLAFSLSLLGTFLVRSGVLSSVHAFASDPQRGLYILGFLVVVVGGALTLYGVRAQALVARADFAPFSRESLLLINNVLLASAAGAVLLGTLYPLLLDALDAGPISVGAPYFEAVFVPLMIPLLLLLGIGPLIAWRRASPSAAVRQLRWVALGSLALAVVVGVGLGHGPGVSLGVGLGAWVIAAALLPLLRGPGSRWARLRSLPAAGWGQLLAHAGLGVLVIGVTLVKGGETSHDFSLRPGERVAFQDYTLHFAGARQQRGPNYLSAQAQFELQQGGRPTLTLRPEKRYYVVQQMPMTEAAIARSPWRDVYLSIGEVAADGRWIVRLQIKPFVGWIWGGAVLIALGGALSAADRRRRATRVAAAVAAPSSSAAALPVAVPTLPA